MAAHSNGRRSRGKAGLKPKKPTKDFPLYAHSSGFWAKKVRSKTVYFTRWADDSKGKLAIEQWLDQKDDLLAGRTPRLKTDDGLTVAELANRFLSHKETLRDNGELSPRTFETYHASCKRFVEHFGKTRLVEDIVPDDFRQFRSKLAQTRKAVTLANEITRVRSLFRFAFDEGLLNAPIRFGQGFSKPRKETIDRDRERRRIEHGVRMLERHELRQVISSATQPMRSMILLAANSGFGNSDVSSLPMKAVNLDNYWIDFARVKNATPRRIPLWRETCESIQEWLRHRPQAKHLPDSQLLFLTCRGQRWVKANVCGSPADAITQEFGKLLKTLHLKRKGLSFYCLRHGFETIGGETGDQVAIDSIMGHKPTGMAAVYRERVSDQRLIRVTEYVRQWLFVDDDTAGTSVPSVQSAKKDLSTESRQKMADDDGPHKLKLFVG